MKPPDAVRRARVPAPVVGALLAYAAVDLPARSVINGVSLGAVSTVIVTLLLMFLLPLALFAPRLVLTPGTAARSVEAPSACPGLPLALWLFLVWVAFGTAINGSAGILGAQSLLLYMSFALCAMLTSSMASTHSYEVVERIVIRIGALQTGGYLASVALGGTNANGLFAARSFGLTSLTLIAVLSAMPASRRRRGHDVLLVLVLGAVLLSLSRTALVAAMLLLVVGLAFRVRRRAAVLRLVVAVAVAGGVGRWLLNHYAPLHDRFFGGDVGLAGINTQGREDLWGAVWGSARESLLAGHGPGSASALVRDRFAGLDQPHNDYLRLLHDFGLVGVALFGLALLALFMRAGRRVRASDGDERAPHLAALLVLFGVVIAMGTDNVIVYLFVMLPLGMFIGLSTAALSRGPTPPGAVTGGAGAGSAQGGLSTRASIARGSG